MPRPVLLFSGSWADLPLEELAAQAAEWGYQGLELCCWGDHFEVQRALSEPDAFPAADLVLRKAVANDRVAVAASALEAMAQAWRPWRAYAVMHLWRSA